MIDSINSIFAHIHYGTLIAFHCISPLYSVRALQSTKLKASDYVRKTGRPTVIVGVSLYGHRSHLYPKILRMPVSIWPSLDDDTVAEV